MNAENGLTAMNPIVGPIWPGNTPPDLSKRPGMIMELTPPPVKPLNILHMTTTDPAGAVYNFVRAMNTYTPHRVRLFCSDEIRYPDGSPVYDFPKDICQIFDPGDEIEALIEEADVIHFHKVTEDDMDLTFEFQAFYQMTKEIKVADYLERATKKKKLVYHVHGHPFERDHTKEAAEIYAKKNAYVLASTPDLEQMFRKFYPNVHYFPNCVPIQDVRYMPRATDKAFPGANGKEILLIGQTPTNTLLKQTDMVKDIAQELVDEGLDVRFLYIMQAKQDWALRNKRNAHIVFDHIEGYYGLSSLEGLSMGKPVVAGLSDYTIEAILKFFQADGIPLEASDLPWVIARDRGQVKAAFRTLLQEKHLRRSIGAYSRKFMEEVWSDEHIARRMAEFYSSL